MTMLIIGLLVLILLILAPPSIILLAFVLLVWGFYDISQRTKRVLRRLRQEDEHFPSDRDKGSH